MISDAQAAETMSAALAGRGIVVADTPSTPATTSDAVAPPAAAPTVDAMIEELNAPIVGGADAPEMAKAFFDAPPTPAGYDLGQAAPGVEQMAAEDQTTIRNFLHAEQFPASAGAELARLWNAAAAAPPTEEMRQQSKQAVTAELNRVHGTERAARMIDDANAEVKRMTAAHPWLPSALEASNLGNARFLIELLHNRATVRKG